MAAGHHGTDPHHHVSPRPPGSQAPGSARLPGGWGPKSRFRSLSHCPPRLVREVPAQQVTWESTEMLAEPGAGAAFPGTEVMCWPGGRPPASCRTPPPRDGAGPRQAHVLTRMPGTRGLSLGSQRGAGSPLGLSLHIRETDCRPDRPQGRLRPLWGRAVTSPWLCGLGCHLPLAGGCPLQCGAVISSITNSPQFFLFFQT